MMTAGAVSSLTTILELELAILLLDARKVQYDSRVEVNLTCARNMPKNATNQLTLSLKEKIATEP